MPDTSSLPSTYNTAQLASRVKGYPLLRDTSHYTYRETYLQNVANFARTALDTAHVDVSALKLVDEDILNQREDLVEFFRLYATIPAAWDEPLSVVFDYPGYAGSWATPGSTISSGVTMANSGTAGRLVISKTAHGLTGGYVRVNFTSGGTYKHTIYALVESYTADTFTLDMRWVGTVTFSAVTYATNSGFPARSIRTEKVHGFIRHEYALPGVTSGVSVAADFRPLARLRFLDYGTGEAVTRLTAATDPSNTAWIADVQAGNHFIIDSDVHVYRGNILERVTSYVPYIY